MSWVWAAIVKANGKQAHPAGVKASFQKSSRGSGAGEQTPSYRTRGALRSSSSSLSLRQVRVERSGDVLSPGPSSRIR